MGGYGTTPFGIGPFGGGAASGFRVLAALAATLNAVDVLFSEPPRAVDPGVANDALRFQGWTLTALSPPTAVVRLAQHVEVTGQVARVFFDGVLTAGALYSIAAAATLEDAAQVEVIDPLARTASFVALRLPVPLTVMEEKTALVDIANPQTSRYASSTQRRLGTFAATSAGSIELDIGLAGLAKRTVRRCITRKGGYLHLPSYGALPLIKGLVRPGDLRKIQQTLQLELLQERDVVSSSVSLRIDPTAPSVVYFGIKVRSQNGVEHNGVFPIDFSEL